MRVVVQRVSRAAVRVDGAVRGEIGVGLAVLVGFAPGDDEAAVQWMADRLVGLRIFSDAQGRMNVDLRTAGGAVLVVSQFTLYGDVSHGRRPSFTGAAPPDVAIPLYEAFLSALRASGVGVASGVFGAHMEVDLVNDGPVTLVIERGP